MTFPPLRRSATRVLQALVSGRVRDGLSGAPPGDGLQVRLTDRNSGAEIPLLSRVRSDGTFVFYGRPETAFPQMANQTYHMRVTASAPGYQDASVDFDIGPVSGQPALLSRPLASAIVPPMQVRLFNNGLPRANLVLTLNRTPVRLRGRIHVAGFVSRGIDHATVSITTPGGPPDAVTDANGNFAFSAPLPVEDVVGISVTAAGFQPLTVPYEPNYAEPINTLALGLRRP